MARLAGQRRHRLTAAEELSGLLGDAAARGKHHRYDMI